MILKFGARNFYSFKDWFEISFKLPEYCKSIIPNNDSLANVLAIRGTNSSGKTNVIKVLSFLERFVRSSFSFKLREGIFFEPFFDSKKSTNLFIVFLHDNIEYTYELEVMFDMVISETLFKKDKRKVKLIERKNNEFTYITNELSNFEAMKLISNVSFISLAKQYEIKEVDFFYDLFSTISSPNLISSGRHDSLFNHKVISKFYNNFPKAFEFAKDIIKRSDFGIIDIALVQITNEETNEIEYLPRFYYLVNKTKKILTFHDQSSGVKSLYLQLAFYQFSLQYGHTLVLDEMDLNLHPDLLPMLIDLYDDPFNNINKSQFIFTTHNVEIMDILGKYRLVFVNKENNQSYLYRLDEFPGNLLRNDRSIINYYNANKLGGRPKLIKKEKLNG